jgi:adenylate cyclase
MVGRSSKPARFLFLHLSISLVITVFILLVTQEILSDFPPLRRAELSLIDRRFQERYRQLGVPSRIRDSSGVVIVALTPETFKSLPEPWPWPRSYYARLVRNLKRAGAKVIGLDILFSSADIRRPREDEEFRRALKDAGNVVLAGELQPEKSDRIISETGENYSNIFIDSSATAGLVNTTQDYDGVVRRYQPFWETFAATDSGQSVRRIPGFSMAVLNFYYNRNPGMCAELSGSGFRYSDREIPRYDSRSFLINYHGPAGTYPVLNLADVLDDADFQTVDERKYNIQTNTFDNPDDGYLYSGIFTGKIVLVGSMIPEDRDLHPTPVNEGLAESRGTGGNQMYGVEIHANVIQSIIDRQFFIRQPLWMTALVVFGLTLFTFVFTAGLKAIRARFSALIELLGLALIMAELFIIYWASLKLFLDRNFLADMSSSFLAVIISYVFGTVYNYLTERRQKVLIKTMFSRYVNPTIVNELVAHPEKLRLGGERKELTVFFSDIENFTRIAEKMSPEDLVMVLNEYLSVMTSIILANNGTLDKYEGDAIVAFWGAPIPQPDHALRACRTAVQMQDSLRGLREIWTQEGKPALSARIGINTDEAIVGNMGGANRFDYTVIGDGVNLGSRLETANKQYRTHIMISEATYRMVEEKVLARELDMLVVAGKTEPIRVYELLGMLGEEILPHQVEFVNIYNTGLASYRRREWSEAIRAFSKALELSPEDYPSELYIERSHLYIASPPPEDWNGVFILRTK